MLYTFGQLLIITGFVSLGFYFLGFKVGCIYTASRYTSCVDERTGKVEYIKKAQGED